MISRIIPLFIEDSFHLGSRSDYQQTLVDFMGPESFVFVLLYICVDYESVFLKKMFIK
ncbi:hypothetical protein THF1C08_50293 [Vibrio jasicida]|uniref:Uncharacterized protein n=1 Tax=Vibrio jasicida TaxID=766224 RepID=A0AAU9QTY7_9VIBR|nr:hypothetical protein THF1C08_50293 [Vibrio jasicida]CAH1601460.1 hypothetical protein THF1A12_50053 [Vibrio jasicida]